MSQLEDMRVISSASAEEAKTKAISYIADNLTAKAQEHQNILWLLSGGSSIAVSVAVAQQLDVAVLKQISVAQVDERFVPPGSDEDNWQQLMDTGLKPENFRQTVSILSCGNTLDTAAVNYARILGDLIKDAKYVSAVFGIGSDGHTGGIKPATDPASFKSFIGPELVVGYQAEDFTRITITAAALKQINDAAVYAVGEDKQPVIQQLENDLPVHVQPAQLLKQIPQLVIFS